MGKEKKRKKSKNSPKTGCGISSAAKDSVSCFNVVTSIKWRVFRCPGDERVTTSTFKCIVVPNRATFGLS